MGKEKSCSLSVTSPRSQDRSQGKGPYTSNFMGCTQDHCSLPCPCRPTLFHRGRTQSPVPLCQAHSVQSRIQTCTSPIVETAPPPYQPSSSFWGLYILTHSLIPRFWWLVKMEMSLTLGQAQGFTSTSQLQTRKCECSPFLKVDASGWPFPTISRKSSLQ